MKSSGDGLLTCDFCGELVRRPKKRRKKPCLCPVCGNVVAESPAEPLPLPEPILPVAEPTIAGTDEDDDQPYSLSGTPRYRCPACDHDLVRDAFVCVQCGLILKTGQHANRTFEPIKRQWVTGMWPGFRLSSFLAAQLAFLTLQVHAWLKEGEPVLLEAWAGFVLLTAFLLGTYDQIDFSRNCRGQMKLTKTWRIAFVPRPPYLIPPAEYVTVTTTTDHEGGFLDWLIFVVLFLSGVIPGLLWWYFHLCHFVFTVTLTNQIGSTRILYRGRNQNTMRGIVETLHKVAGLRPV